NVARAGLALVLALPGAHALAQTVAVARAPTLEIGAGVAALPDYTGSRHVAARARLWVDASAPTDRFGTFALDSGSLTLAPALRWAPLDDPKAGASLLL